MSYDCEVPAFEFSSAKSRVCIYMKNRVNMLASYDRLEQPIRSDII